MDIYIINTATTNNISPELLEQYKKREFKNIKQRNIHSLTYLMLDRILATVYQINNREIIFIDKKPYLKTPKKYISISHSGEYIVLAFSDYDCGIDIEKIKDRNFINISSRMGFNSENLKDFYKNWTEYEAKYKLGCASQKTFYIETLDNYFITSVSSNKDETFEIYFQN